MSGQNKNRVTVKMNGRFWDEKRDDIPKEASRKRTPKDDTPRVRFQAPPLLFTDPLKEKGNEAWERMMQLRGSATKETKPNVEFDQTTNDSYESDYSFEDTEEKGYRSSPVSRLAALWPKGPFWRTTLTTGGAVAIGLLFGFLVLTVFSQKEFSESYGNVLSETVQTLTAPGAGTEQTAGKNGVTGPASPNESQPTQETPTNGNAVGQKAIALQLPAVNMYVAQAGVFQPDASPQTAVEPLEKAGIPHLLYKDASKQYMFAAAAPTRDAVLGFAASLKNKGMDIYVKEFSFPAFEGSVPVGKAANASGDPNVKAFFTHGVKLVQTLSAQSGLIITTGQLSPTAKETAELKEIHRQFLEESRKMEAKEAWKPLLDGMVNGVNQALAARDKMAEASAGKKVESAESYAWQVQAGVLAFFESYASWIQNARPST
ncbi:MULTISPECIES: hypothetical protein [Brevibacillus]|uniref:SPOR domain-containing protein n=1 Tax=Brevibacillus porteri TaxID=2126350 RepID=A0ABX5FWW8_9BACL|nr:MULTISPECIES: hypothetical protein [Brevibacillus]MDC0763306.1 hypothetical protein [Brevibacillus sp. AG]MED1798982.1 hypothetical protein [Brevibacillus porteri]MED2130110.1 hypothetical protein [Brevibacillus porteri]MED2746532.1 hypothetical protein [Brevibacillus porteri]MED2814629.1 hypothetical protein [Brevibacillus porteri]